MSCKRWTRRGLHAGWLAGVCFALALWILGRMQPGHVAARHAVADLGALDMPHAWAWNLAGFIMPGLMLLLFAFALEAAMQREQASRIGRIGTGLLMIAALAFAAQGVLPLDLHDLDGAVSRRHVTALVVALLAQMAAAGLISLALLYRPGWRLLSLGGAVLAALLLLVLLFPPQQQPWLQGQAGYAQRLVFGIYFGWFALAAFNALRRNAGTV